MANAPEEIRLLWVTLVSEKISVSPAFWLRVEDNFLKQLDRLSALLDARKGQCLSIEEAKVVASLAGEMGQFLHGIEKSPDTGLQITDGVIKAGRSARELLNHHLGNDLYRIILMSDTGGPQPEGIEPQTVVKMQESVEAMREFWRRFRESTSKA